METSKVMCSRKVKTSLPCPYSFQMSTLKHLLMRCLVGRPANHPRVANNRFKKKEYLSAEGEEQWLMAQKTKPTKTRSSMSYTTSSSREEMSAPHLLHNHKVVRIEAKTILNSR